MRRETQFWIITMLGTIIIIIIFSIIFISLRAYTYYCTHKPTYYGDSLFSPDPVIGFRQRPNVTITMTNPKVTFFTDNRGGRALGPGMRAPSKVDVLAIGCSFTWGQAIQYEDTFIRIIGRELGISTYNAGVSSYGTTASLLSLKNYADLQPKIVIYGFIADHINRSLNPCAPCLSGLCRGVAHVGFDSAGNPKIMKPVTSPLYYKHNKDIFVDYHFGLKNIYWEIVRTLNFIPKWESRIDNYNKNQIVSAMNFLIKEMVRETQKMGAKLIIIYIPYPEEVTPPPKEFMRAINNIITDKKAFFVDLTLPFLDARERHELLSTQDGHPNALSNRIIAENIIPVVRVLLK